VLKVEKKLSQSRYTPLPFSLVVLSPRLDERGGTTSTVPAAHTKDMEFRNKLLISFQIGK